MRVKLLRPSSTPSVSTDADVFTSRWSRLSAFINAVQALRHEVSAPPRFSLEELHSDVVDVCLVHDASKLFLHLREKFESRVAALMRPLEAEAAGAFESPFIDNVAAAWNTYCKEVSFIMMVFLHLDRSYVMELPGSQSLWDVGIAIWGATFSQHERIVAVAVRRLCELIRKEREGEVVDRNVLATLTGMFQAVSLFSSAIVPPVLAATKEFYEVEGVKLINSCDVPAYLLNIETRLRREVRLFRAHQQRPLRITSYGPSTVIPKTLQIDAAGAYFDSTSKEGASLQRSILKCVDCALIERHAGTLVERGLAHLLEQRNREDLKRLYQFLSRVGHTNTLRIHFGHYIKVSDTSTERRMQLIDLS
jgi:cullin-4